MGCEMGGVEAGAVRRGLMDCWEKSGRLLTRAALQLRFKKFVYRNETAETKWRRIRLDLKKARLY